MSKYYWSQYHHPPRTPYEQSEKALRFYQSDEAPEWVKNPEKHRAPNRAFPSVWRENCHVVVPSQWVYNRPLSARDQATLEFEKHYYDYSRGWGMPDCLPEFTGAGYSSEQSRVDGQNYRAAKCGFDGRLDPADWREVMAAYGGKCAYCGSAKQIQMDHVMPLSRGGTNTIDNVVPACAKVQPVKGVHDR